MTDIRREISKAPISFVDKGKGQSAPKETKDYRPTDIIGTCDNCGLQCTVHFPNGSFSWNVGDRIMDREKVFKCFCLACKKETTWTPFDPKKHTEKELDLIRRNQEELLRRRPGGGTK